VADLTREEMVVRIEAVEARVETKFVIIDGKLDRLFDRVETGINFSRDAKTAASNIKWNIIFTALAVIGIMFAAWALWAQGVEMVSGIFEAVSTQSSKIPPPPDSTPIK